MDSNTNAKHKKEKVFLTLIKEVSLYKKFVHFNIKRNNI